MINLKNRLLLIAGIPSAVILTLTAFSGFKVIEPGEAAVVTVLGTPKNEILEEGLHYKMPIISRVKVYDLKVQKFQVKARAATKDLQTLTGTFAINFTVSRDNLLQIVRTQGDLKSIIQTIIIPQTQESFKIASAQLKAEEAVVNREKLKLDFDTALRERLKRYNLNVLDTSIVNIDFSEEFAAAVEEKQIAEQRAQRAVYIAQEAAQEAQAEINRAKGKAEAQRLLAETLKAQGGDLVLQKEAIEAWRKGGAQMPEVLVMGGGNSGGVPFIFNLDNK